MSHMSNQRFEQLVCSVCVCVCAPIHAGWPAVLMCISALSSDYIVKNRNIVMATEEQSDTDEHKFGFLTRNQT